MGDTRQLLRPRHASHTWPSSTSSLNATLLLLVAQARTLEASSTPGSLRPTYPYSFLTKFYKFHFLKIYLLCPLLAISSGPPQSRPLCLPEQPPKRSCRLGPSLI